MKETITVKFGFPYINLGKVRIRHSKVTKISAYGYMLLTAIERLPKEENMVNCLAEFGIHGDMVDLFSDEAYKLIVSDRPMLRYNDSVEGKNVFRSKFNKLKLKDLEMTDMGRKLYRDQYVFVGGDRETKEKELYYDVVKRSLSIQRPKNSGPSNIDYTALVSDEDRRMVSNESVKDNLNEKMRKELNLSDEEFVTEVEMGISKIESYPVDVTIEIGIDGAEFLCDDPEYLEFITKHYGKGQMNELLEKWPTDGGPVKRASLNEIGQFAALRNVKSLLSGNFKYLLGCEELKTSGHEREITFSTEQVKGLIGDETCCGMSIDGKGHVDRFERIRLNVHYVGEKGVNFDIDVIEKKSLTEELSREIMSGLLNICLLTKDVKNIGWLSEVMNEDGRLREFAKNEVSGGQDGIGVLKDLHSKLSEFEIWKPLSMELAQSLAEKESDGVTVDDIGYKAIDLLKLKSILKEEDEKILCRLTDKLPLGYNRERAFKNLFEIGKVQQTIALKLVNIIEIYVDKIIRDEEIDGTGEIADQFEGLGHNFRELKKMVGMEKDPVKFTQREVENVSFFKTQMGFLSDKFRNLEEKYSEYAAEGFATLLLFYNGLVKINAILEGKSVKEYSKLDFQKEADAKPEICLSNLQTRMEIELRRILGLSDTAKVLASKLLNDARDKERISDEDFTVLDEMRELRNKSRHYGEMDTDALRLHKCIEAVWRIVQSEPKPISNKEIALKPQNNTTSYVVLQYNEKDLKSLFQKNPQEAIRRLVECEEQKLLAITGRSKGSMDIAAMTNHAKMSHMISMDVAKQLEELNRSRKATNKRIPAGVFGGWVKTVFSLNKEE